MSSVAIVTGGGSGIGRAVALALAGSGWRVIIAGRREGALAAVCAQRRGDIAAVTTDIRDERSVRHLLDQAAAMHARVDLLFQQRRLRRANPQRRQDHQQRFAVGVCAASAFGRLYCF